MPTLGVAIITKNAALHLSECLRAVAWADRIVVLDSGSTDTTCQIARDLGAELHVSADWPGFGPQKNRVLALLDTDWVLSLDADEVVSPELASAIQQALVQANTADVYSLARRSALCGQWVAYSGWNPDLVPRLFRRTAARFSDDLVHERLVYAGEAPVLPGLLLHYSYDNLEQVLTKINAYSSAGAQQRWERGAPGSGLGKAIVRGLWAFCRTYFLKRGFLDGRAGFIIAVMNAETTYYRFLKLAQLQRSSSRP